MNQSRQLKIWTLLTHAFIIIGAGHGIAPLFIFEFGGLFAPFSNDFFADEVHIALCVVILLALIGQLLLIFSIIKQIQPLKRNLQIGGLLLLFCSIMTLSLITYFDTYTVLLYITCVPFFICILIALFSRSVGNLFRQHF